MSVYIEKHLCMDEKLVHKNCVGENVFTYEHKIS